MNKVIKVQYSDKCCQNKCFIKKIFTKVPMSTVSWKIWLNHICFIPSKLEVYFKHFFFQQYNTPILEPSNDADHTNVPQIQNNLTTCKRILATQRLQKSYSFGLFKSASSNNTEPAVRESVDKSARKPHFPRNSTSSNLPTLPCGDKVIDEISSLNRSCCKKMYSTLSLSIILEKALDTSIVPSNVL